MVTTPTCAVGFHVERAGGPVRKSLARVPKALGLSIEVFPEPLSPQTSASPRGGISSSACSMQHRPLTVTSARIMSPHLTDPDRRVAAAPLSTDPRRRSLPRGGRGSPGPGRPRERRAMTLRWTPPGCIRCSLLLMRNYLRNGSSPRRSRLRVTAARVWRWVPRVPRGTRDRSCSEIPGPRTQGPRAERPLAAARGSICPLCSTWNPSPGVPQPGRGLSAVNGPWSLGRNSMTEHLRAYGECAGFAAAPEADHGGDHGHADAPISEALRLAAAAVLFAVTASARSQAATGAQASGQRAAAADRSSGKRPSNAAGAPPDDASANLASGPSVNAVLTKPVDSTRSRPGDPVSARTTQIATTEGGTSILRPSLSGHVSEARAGAEVRDPRRARVSQPAPWAGLSDRARAPPALCRRGQARWEAWTLKGC